MHYIILLLSLSILSLPNLAQVTEIPQPPSIRAENSDLVDTLRLMLSTISIGDRQVQART